MATKPSSTPTWATDAGSTQEPNTAKKAAGWANGERPPAKFLNWWQNLVFRWVEYFDDGREGAKHGTIDVPIDISNFVEMNGSGAAMQGDGQLNIPSTVSDIAWRISWPYDTSILGAHARVKSTTAGPNNGIVGLHIVTTTDDTIDAPLASKATGIGVNTWTTAALAAPLDSGTLPQVMSDNEKSYFLWLTNIGTLTATQLYLGNLSIRVARV